MSFDRKKLSRGVALWGLASIADTGICHSRANCFASSAARQYVSRQGGCPAKKLRDRELVAAISINTNPRSGVPLPTRPVTANSVNDSGTTQYPSSSTEDGHGDKGRAEIYRTQLSKSARFSA